MLSMSRTSDKYIIFFFMNIKTLSSLDIHQLPGLLVVQTAGHRIIENIIKLILVYLFMNTPAEQFNNIMLRYSIAALCTQLQWCK